MTKTTKKPAAKKAPAKKKAPRKGTGRKRAPAKKKTPDLRETGDDIPQAPASMKEQAVAEEIVIDIMENRATATLAMLDAVGDLTDFQQEHPFTAVDIVDCKCVDSLPHYLPPLMHGIETGEEVVFRSVITSRLLRGVYQANSLNRSPVNSHVVRLMREFRTNWRPGLSQVCMTSEGDTINAGHTIRALTGILLPDGVIIKCGFRQAPEEIIGADGKAQIDPVTGTARLRMQNAGLGIKLPKDMKSLHEGWVEPVDDSEFRPDAEEPKLSKDWDQDDWLDYADHLIAEHFADTGRVNEITVTVNAERGMLQLFDDVARGRQAPEQLEQNAFTRKFCQESPLFQGNFILLSQVLKGLYLRWQKTTEMKDGKRTVTLGTAKGGGNITKIRFPTFGVAAARQLYRLDDLFRRSLIAGEGEKAQHEIRGKFDNLPRLRVLIALAAVGDLESARLFGILQGTTHDAAPEVADAVQQLNARYVKPTKGDQNPLTGTTYTEVEIQYWAEPQATYCEAVLIAASNNGLIDPTEETASVPQQSIGRGHGWDRGETNDWDELCQSVLLEVAHEIDTRIGDDANRASKEVVTRSKSKQG